MEYKQPKDFVNKLDQSYLIYISVPILFFFVYYCYFIYNVGKGVLDEPIINNKIIIGYLCFWIVPLMIYFKKKKTIILEALNENNLQNQCNHIFQEFKKLNLMLLVFTVIALVVFYFTNNQMMGLPVWLFVVMISIEKPNIFRVVKLFKFKTKEEYDSFIKNEWP